MGGYGHSRVREFLFGGVTRYFLEDAAGPALFLAH
jgi:nucleotide-binding universal stress UspA family protein